MLRDQSSKKTSRFLVRASSSLATRWTLVRLVLTLGRVKASSSLVRSILFFHLEFFFLLFVTLDAPHLYGANTVGIGTRFAGLEEKKAAGNWKDWIFDARFSTFALRLFLFRSQFPPLSADKPTSRQGETDGDRGLARPGARGASRPDAGLRRAIETN